jgi:hypothetical protein
VKKTISIFLLSLYVFTAFQISEYLKLPILVQHFYEHQQENPSLNLFEFLSMHYAHGEVFDADYDKDMKLPFKSHHANCSCSVTVFYVPIQNYSFVYNTFSSEFPKPVFGYNFSFISNFHSSIWQPPKIC